MMPADIDRPLPPARPDLDGQPVVVPNRFGIFVPVLLLTLAFVGWTAFQCAQLLMERQQLMALQTSLQPQEQAATKLRASLDAVATATAKLSAQGNASARAVVDELKRRGVTINAASAPASN